MFHLRFTHSFTLWRLPITGISILRDYILRYTQWPNKEGFFIGDYRHKYLLWNWNRHTTCVLIDSILFIISKLFVICYFHHIFLSVDIRIGINSSRQFFVLSFRLNRLHVVFLILYTDSTLCRYPDAPTYCCRNIPMCRHTNAPTLHCFNKKICEMVRRSLELYVMF